MLKYTSGTPFATRLGALLSAKERKCEENSESDASEGWTEITTSLAMYAIRATIPTEMSVTMNWWRKTRMNVFLDPALNGGRQTCSSSSQHCGHS
jgi:hypothetical protein